MKRKQNKEVYSHCMMTKIKQIQHYEAFDYFGSTVVTRHYSGWVDHNNCAFQIPRHEIMSPYTVNSIFSWSNYTA